jgi:hypothetical protein
MAHPNLASGKVQGSEFYEVLRMLSCSVQVQLYKTLLWLTESLQNRCNSSRRHGHPSCMDVREI